MKVYTKTDKSRQRCHKCRKSIKQGQQYTLVYYHQAGVPICYPNCDTELTK